MTASTPLRSALNVSLGGVVTPEVLGELERIATLVRFRPGQLMSEADALPSTVYLVLEGQARLLEVDPVQERWTTLGKLGPGQWVGLASLLMAKGCEQVTASTELVAAAFSDRELLELLKKQSSLRGWCSTQLFPAELSAVLRHLFAEQLEDGFTLANLLAEALGRSKSFLPNQEALELASEKNLQLVLSCANTHEASFGDLLSSAPGNNDADTALPLRAVGLPKEWLEQRRGRYSKGDEKHEEPSAHEIRFSQSPDVQAAPEWPQPSGLDLSTESERAAELQLRRGSGLVNGTLACLQMLGQVMDLPIKRDNLEKVLRDVERRGQTLSLQLAGQLCSSLGLHVALTRVPTQFAGRIQTPALLLRAGELVLVNQSNADGLKLACPSVGWLSMGASELEAEYPEGLEVLVLDRTISTPESKFGPAWFWPAVKRYRPVLLQVLVASFVVQLFTLANPLMVQIIIDKVINQRSLDTLQVVGIALVAVAILEQVLSSLRTFLFVETTNRIDLRLGSEVIDHLVRLPLGYFDRRPVGELASRISELEKIRSFLTGQALTTVLDACFAVIYIVVMAFYSGLLTIVALGVIPIQVGLTVLGAPLFRRQFRSAAEENAKTQSHLVEVLTGIQTVKAQNVEMVSRWTWQNLYSQYIRRTFEKTITATTLTGTSQVLQKISQLLVLWVGAAMVLKGEMTLGQLIAFRIISGYVTDPLLRLSTIWQNVQELRVSFERLADVLDTPQESSKDDKGKIPLPPIQGDVRFENLEFGFKAGLAPVLNNVNLHIKPGEFVGIVGQSGSGKSTLMKLLPRLYSPQKGRILIDGYDIDKVELYSLRRQIGIVPQDPLLFSGSVSDNIALTNPEATSDEIVRAAQLADAHDFVMELPSGYSSPVGERGAGLSGGQRQRIAIARTLLAQPKLLVMDEATSALDYSTERRVCENLRQELKGCTVFFITHRLSTIRNADRILMMDKGVVVEQGTHEELLAAKGRYFALYRQQEASS